MKFDEKFAKWQENQKFKETLEIEKKAKEKQLKYDEDLSFHQIFIDKIKELKVLEILTEIKDELWQYGKIDFYRNMYKIKSEDTNWKDEVSVTLSAQWPCFCGGSSVIESDDPYSAPFSRNIPAHIGYQSFNAHITVTLQTWNRKNDYADVEVNTNGIPRIKIGCPASEKEIKSLEDEIYSLCLKQKKEHHFPIIDLVNRDKEKIFEKIKSGDIKICDIRNESFYEEVKSRGIIPNTTLSSMPNQRVGFWKK
jgi:hypothetical protein